jgi:CubicO group peptidase (beta-lactamase class C family)
VARTALISEKWVKLSFSPWNRSAPELRQPDYGWFWWKYDGGPGWTALLANGWKGQRIAVFPRQRVVVTMTACIQDGSERRVFDLLIARVVRAVRRDAPIAADPANRSKLNAMLEEVRLGFSPPCAGGDARMIPSIAPKARRVSFKRDVPPDSPGRSGPAQAAGH